VGAQRATTMLWLTGTVSSKETKVRATTIAEGLQGVTRVVNQLVVVPA
jgi:osmotically-inducible protein OsmY